MKKTFETTIVRAGAMCFIPLPFDPRPVFGKVRAPVRVTLPGYSYRSTIASMGHGRCVPLRRSHREAAGLRGDESLRVTLELDTAERTVDAPDDLVRALKAEPSILRRWRALSYTHRREHVEAIAEAKAPETRARRIEAAVRMLASVPQVSARRKASASSPAAATATGTRTGSPAAATATGTRTGSPAAATATGTRAGSPAHAGDARGHAGERRGRGAATTRYALLLRGVNVGTKNSLPMAELRAMLEKLGCTEVRTYVQSGNAVFGTRLGAAALTAAIEEALGRYMGRPIATTLRTHAELSAIVAANPFADVATNPAYLCVTFLSQPPAKAELAPLHADDFQPELFRAAGREIYAWHPNGQGRSRLAAVLQKLPFRGAVTTRNWNTVLKLVEMLAVH